MKDPLGAVHALEVAVHLGAQEALGEAVLGVSAEYTVIDLGDVPDPAVGDIVTIIGSDGWEPNGEIAEIGFFDYAVALSWLALCAGVWAAYRLHK